MEAIRLCSLREKVFFPRKWHHSEFTGGCDLSQDVRCCHTDPMIPSTTF